MSRATNLRASSVDRLPAQRLVRAGHQRRGGRSAAGPARPRRTDRAVPHQRRHARSRWRTATPTSPIRSARAGRRRHDRVGLFRLRVRRPRALRPRADPGRDPGRRAGARVPGARRRCLRLGLARRSAPGRACARRRSAGSTMRTGRRSATPGRPRPMSPCCTRTSPTSPTSRWWIRSSLPRCCAARRRRWRWRSPRPRCRSPGTTRRRRSRPGMPNCSGCRPMPTCAAGERRLRLPRSVGGPLGGGRRQ